MLCIPLSLLYFNFKPTVSYFDVGIFLCKLSTFLPNLFFNLDAVLMTRLDHNFSYFDGYIHLALYKVIYVGQKECHNIYLVSQFSDDIAQNSKRFTIIHHQRMEMVSNKLGFRTLKVLNPLENFNYNYMAVQ